MLKLSRHDYDSLRQHGEETYPNECCGILLGRMEDDGTRIVTSIARAGNTRTDSAHNRYNIDPKELVRIQREGRARGEDIVGFYHSHPDHPAHWSSTDLAEAHWFGCSYVITSVEKGKAALTNSFELAGTDEFDKQLLDEEVAIPKHGAKWKSAVAGSAVCGLLGPLIGLALLEVEIHRPQSFREIAGVVVVALKGWTYAFIVLGPAALLFGGVCGLLLSTMSSKYRSTKVDLAAAAVLGLVLGSGVPVVTILLTVLLNHGAFGEGVRQEISDILPVAAVTGIICAFLLLFLLHRAHLLYRRPLLTGVG